MESTTPTSPDAPSTGRYVPRFRRDPNAATAVAMPRNFQTPVDALGMELARLGWAQGTGPNWYYPEKHPHIHLGKGNDGWFIAFSDGKQGAGGGGTSMVRRGSRLQDYAWGKGELLKRDRGDGVALSKAVIDVVVDGGYQALCNMPR